MISKILKTTIKNTKNVAFFGARNGKGQAHKAVDFVEHISKNYKTLSMIGILGGGLAYHTFHQDNKIANEKDTLTPEVKKELNDTLTQMHPKIKKESQEKESQEKESQRIFQNLSLLWTIPYELIKRLCSHQSPEMEEGYKYQCPLREKLDKICEQRGSTEDLLTVRIVNQSLDKSQVRLTKIAFEAMVRDIDDKKYQEDNRSNISAVDAYVSQINNQIHIARAFHASNENEGAILHLLFAAHKMIMLSLNSLANEFAEHEWHEKSGHVSANEDVTMGPKI